MSHAHKHSIEKEVAPNGATQLGSQESPGASATPAQLEPQEVIKLSATKNRVETITVPAQEQTIINGRYILESEDETYFYVYRQMTYRERILKDEAKQNIRYRDEKGRLLPGYSLVKETRSEDTVVAAKRRKRFTKKTAEKYLENDLIADLIDEIQTGDLSDKDRINAKLALVNYVKPTLSKNTQENVVRIVNDEFEDAQVVEDEDEPSKNEDYD